jgi:hypothetical protein
MNPQILHFLIIFLTFSCQRELVVQRTLNAELLRRVDKLSSAAAAGSASSGALVSKGGSIISVCQLTI